MKSRDHISFYINETRFDISGDQCFITLSDFLRYERGLTGTKVVCAEGDCGACTVLVASPHELDRELLQFKTVNACILPLFAIDACQVVSVEGLREGPELHPVQQSMLDHFGAQCGYCTPGFICSMASLLEDSTLQKKPITEKRAKNYMTGNLCRCTGYDPILKAALAMPKATTLQKRFSKRVDELKKLAKISVKIESKDSKVFLPTKIDEAIKIKAKYPDIRVIAGATDFGVAVNKGRASYQHKMSLQNISSLWQIKEKKSYVDIPARVSLAVLQKYFKKTFPEMDQLLNIFASLQIKNAATLVGNVVNASPIADTIPFLMVHDALVVAESIKGTRLIPIDEFYLGYKNIDLKKIEIVTAIRLPLGREKQISKLYKVSLRKDLDISAVTLATRFQLKKKNIVEARIAFGGVGPVVIRLKNIESQWQGLEFNKTLLSDLAANISDYVSPISDVRGSKEYRLLLCRNLLLKMAEELS